jgi:hypothetical protein
MLTSTEPTFEGLTKQFHNHHPSLGIFASEGGQFIGGHAMYEENKLRTASGLSELWDKERHAASVLVKGPRCSPVEGLPCI